MDGAQIAELTDKLGQDIDGLRDALEPLTKESLNELASKLPVLDRAKLYAMAAYSLESVLFSNLRLSGVDAKSHAVFTELARVRQYFDKIRVAETGETKPRMTIDKAAVGRMIKYELASNNRNVSQARQQPQGTKRKFDDSSNATETGDVAAKPEATNSDEKKAEGKNEVEEVKVEEKKVKEKKGKKKEAVEEVNEDKAGDLQDDFMDIEDDSKKDGKSKKKKKKNKKAISGRNAAPEV